MTALFRLGLHRAANVKTFVIAVLVLSALLFFIHPDEKNDEGGSTALEERLARVLSNIDGAGKVAVMVNESEEEIQGVLIVAEGAEDIGVRLSLLNAAKTALGIENARINVYQMEEWVNEKDR
ncbi:MAG: hypothetical protein IJC48_03920 [Clostridia bacterium]|nr:hypothetical protein [Clostridia bacterium]